MLQSDGPEFNLLKEPWIVVMGESGTTTEVNLCEIFVNAHRYRGLANELPTLDVAILRLLLAILYCVYGRYDPNGGFSPIYDDGEMDVSTQDVFLRWRRIWEDGEFSHPVLYKYLTHYRDRFWLFHPDRPFYQVPELELATHYTAAKLNGEVSESSNKVRLFLSRSGQSKDRLGFAEAARWLLHVNAFDDTSAKPKVKGLPSPGAGWLGKLGLVAASGNNLFETLMLNLALLRDGQVLWEPGVAIWELEEARSEERCEIPIPRSPAELLTLQSRRLLLHREDQYVIGYSLLGGDFFPPENAFVEQMTGWRQSQENKRGPIEYKPRRHDPSRQMWRDFASLFVSRGGAHPPGVVSWVKQLQCRHFFDHSLVRFQIAAMKYGDKDFFVDDVYSDGIAFHTDLLEREEMEGSWVERVLQEIETTEALVTEVSGFAQKILLASGVSDNGKQPVRRRRIAMETREQAYYRLDQPFRQWLEEIDPTADEPSEVSSKWWTQSQSIIRELAKELVTQRGRRAYAERVIKEGDKEIRIPPLPQAYEQFWQKTRTPETLRGGKKRESI